MEDGRVVPDAQVVGRDDEVVRERRVRRGRLEDAPVAVVQHRVMHEALSLDRYRARVRVRGRVRVRVRVRVEVEVRRGGPC